MIEFLLGAGAFAAGVLTGAALFKAASDSILKGGTEDGD